MFSTQLLHKFKVHFFLREIINCFHTFLKLNLSIVLKLTTFIKNGVSEQVDLCVLAV